MTPKQCFKREQRGVSQMDKKKKHSINFIYLYMHTLRNICVSELVVFLQYTLSGKYLYANLTVAMWSFSLKFLALCFVT